eukprot:CAMPEP_0176025828 /NCGR_PEP_ID=MMETSP0120_2-20121206/12643_1 /TAXON_ID=160619 /ORGANISM="Kryptoperidinium foliaceum, Strain CCMP 1326" /LENGTH=94 /DNA_ID=CAMNT_0017359019 /DNA_START=112 /DNA_END=396 /DNA_ORIENTATION=+
MMKSQNAPSTPIVDCTSLLNSLAAHESLVRAADTSDDCSPKESRRRGGTSETCNHQCDSLKTLDDILSDALAIISDSLYLFDELEDEELAEDRP